MFVKGHLPLDQKWGNENYFSDVFPQSWSCNHLTLPNCRKKKIRQTRELQFLPDQESKTSKYFAQDRTGGRPPAPSVPPPGWEELLPKEEQSLLWQPGGEHQDLSKMLAPEKQQNGDIIWQKPESTVWPDESDELADGWQGGYGPLTVQVSLL